MSGLLAGKVWQSNLDGTLKPLAACLADIANDDGTSIYPSIDYVCWLMNKSPRAIQYQLKSLVDKGVLEVVSEATGRPGEFKEFKMNESELPHRKSWKETKRGAKIAGAKKDKRGAISTETGADPDISPYKDPSSEPSIPVISAKQSKPRRTAPQLIPPFIGEAFIQSLQTYKASRTRALKTESELLLYDDLREWGEAESIIALTGAAKAGHLQVLHPDKYRQNGNGYHRPARTSSTLAAVRDRLSAAEERERHG